LPRAAGLAAAIKEACEIEAIIRPGLLDQFDVYVKGQRVFCRKEQGGFAQHQDVIDAIWRIAEQASAQDPE